MDLTPQSRDLLLQGAETLGLSLSSQAVDQFTIYYSELIRWNRAVNLTAIVEEREVVMKHFLDSLTILPWIPRPGGRGHLAKVGCHLADLGTGAGFPGIPVGIVRPEVAITLVERSKRKCQFLKHLARLLKLERVTIVNQDARQMGKDSSPDRVGTSEKEPAWQGKFEAIVSRASFSLVDLARLAEPLLAPEGWVIAMKGPGVEKEIQELGNARGVRLRIREQVDLALPISQERRMLVILGWE